MANNNTQTTSHKMINTSRLMGNGNTQQENITGKEKKKKADLVLLTEWRPNQKSLTEQKSSILIDGQKAFVFSFFGKTGSYYSDEWEACVCRLL